MYVASTQANPQADLKIIKSQASLQGTQIHNKCPQGHFKNIKTESKVIRISIYVKRCLLQYLPYENLVLRALAVQISSQKAIQKVTRKQARQYIKISSLSVYKTLKIRSPN